MSLQLIVNPEAEADLSQARQWYDEKRAELGDRFLMSVEAVFDRICRHPELHAIVYRDLRMALVRRFPYAVIYRDASTDLGGKAFGILQSLRLA